VGLSAYTNIFGPVRVSFVIRAVALDQNQNGKIDKIEIGKVRKLEIAKSQHFEIKSLQPYNFKIGNPRKNLRESVGCNPQRESGEALCMFGC
jgi:hypothetical protein